MHRTELTDEERLRRWEEGARTLAEIDPVKWGKLQRQRFVPAVFWGGGAILLLVYTTGVLAAYDSLFLVEQTAPQDAKKVLEYVSPGPALPPTETPACTCPPQ